MQQHGTVMFNICSEFYSGLKSEFISKCNHTIIYGVNHCDMQIQAYTKAPSQGIMESESRWV